MCSDSNKKTNYIVRQNREINLLNLINPTYYCDVFPFPSLESCIDWFTATAWPKCLPNLVIHWPAALQLQLSGEDEDRRLTA
jgi:hypothetical protein